MVVKHRFSGFQKPLENLKTVQSQAHDQRVFRFSETPLKTRFQVIVKWGFSGFSGFHPYRGFLWVKTPRGAPRLKAGVA
jgi:hypothetical protein